jgi:hypothetical protein
MCEVYTFSPPFAFTACTKLVFSIFFSVRDFFVSYVADVLNYGAEMFGKQKW